MITVTHLEGGGQREGTTVREDRAGSQGHRQWGREGRGGDQLTQPAQYLGEGGGEGREGEYRSETFHYVQNLEALLPFTYTILLIHDKKLMQYL